jgi:hypothetical protein
MARFTFGGSSADFTFDLVRSGTAQLMAIAGGDVVTFWDSQVGGTQYDDLLAGADGSGGAISSITSDQFGMFPEFQGPDGVTKMYADAGGPRVAIAADAAQLVDEVQSLRDAAQAAEAAAEAWAQQAQEQVGSIDPGVAGGIATLDSGAAVPASQLAHTDAVMATALANSASASRGQTDARYASDPKQAYAGTSWWKYGDSWIGEYGLSSNGFITQTAAALSVSTVHNLAEFGSPIQSWCHLMLQNGGGFAWAAQTGGAVIAGTGLNDSRYTDLSLAANLAYKRAARNSLDIAVALWRGNARVGWTTTVGATAWGYAGTWTSPGYAYSTVGTLARTTVKGSVAALGFTGNEVSVIIGTDNAGSKCVVECAIDGVVQAPRKRLHDDGVVYPGGANTVAYRLLRFTDLEDGPHSLTITKVDPSTDALYIDSAVTPNSNAPDVYLVEPSILDASAYTNVAYAPYNNGTAASTRVMQRMFEDVAREWEGVHVVADSLLTGTVDYQADDLHPNASTGTPKLVASLTAKVTQAPTVANRAEDRIAGAALGRGAKKKITKNPKSVTYRYDVPGNLYALSIPDGAIGMRIRACGPGGGGGSARRGAAGTVCCGGGAGGSGGYMDTFLTTEGLPATVYVTVGAGGNGGAAVGADSTNGAPGTSGNPTYVTTDQTVPADESVYLAYACAGKPGAGGTAATGSAGAAQASSAGLTAVGAAASTTGGAGLATAANGYNGLGQGGGSGGGITAAGAQSAGGAGWWSNLFMTAVLAAPAGGVAGGGAGTSGIPTRVSGVLRTEGSGAGGGSNLTGPGGAGGAGGRGSGGGGGGASLNGSASGAGGVGGDGFVEITFYF